MTNHDMPVFKPLASLEKEVDSTTLAYMFEGATGWVEQHAPQINKLNVFPVPDGDTGTNMMLTLQSAIKKVRAQAANSQTVSEVAFWMARGALMGARGNSGVILSQILQGIADRLKDKELATCVDLTLALRQATKKAYQSVTEPVEGTMLTVIRETAEAAELYVENGGNDVVSFMHSCVEAAKRAELKTPELLPVLKQAGVTDSGGYGLWLFLEGALRHLRGEESILSKPLSNTQWDDLTNMVGHPQADNMVGEGPWGYDVQFLIKARTAQRLDVSKIRLHIESLGECPLVVGDEELLKVHLHCPNPGIPITYAAEQGSISDVIVEDMDAQAEAFLQQPLSVDEAFPPLINSAKTTEELTGIGIIAVAPGEGLVKLFRSLGVSQVIHGGQTMNPSIKELLQAIEATTAQMLIVLPNNKNIILTANQLPTLTSKKVYILPTRSVPQGIAAIMGFNYAGDIEENYATMQDAMTYVQTGEVTIATRNTTVDDLAITEGDIIGLLNGQLIVAAQSPELVIRSILERLDLSDYEVITFYYGEQITPEEAQALIKSLKTDYQQLELEAFSGGQPHYHYIFSVE